MEARDFADMQGALWALRKTQVDLAEIVKPQSLSLQQQWEWAGAVEALLSVAGERMQFETVQVLDVDPRGSLLGPTLAYMFGAQVTEYCLQTNDRVDRQLVNQWLEKKGRRTLRVEKGLMPSVEMEYDAVIANDLQQNDERTWETLCGRVKKNGMLYVTVSTKRLGQRLIVKRVDLCRGMGFTTMGKPTWVDLEDGVYKIGLIRMTSVTN